jgi:hypothetical protein
MMWDLGTLWKVKLKKRFGRKRSWPTTITVTSQHYQRDIIDQNKRRHETPQFKIITFETNICTWNFLHIHAENILTRHCSSHSTDNLCSPRLTDSPIHGVEPFLRSRRLCSHSNFPAFYGTRMFITVYTKSLHWTLSWARSIQSIPSDPISRSSGQPTRSGSAWR